MAGEKATHTSSGGVVYRKSNGEISILLLHRFEGDTWHLPKGTVREGEPLTRTALREVEEEAGVVKATIGCYLGALSSQFHRRDTLVDKTTHYFLISTQEEIGQKDSEHDEVRWVPISKAVKLVKTAMEYYKGEVEDEAIIIAKAMEQLQKQ